MTSNYSFRRAVLLLLISGIVLLSARSVVAIENSAVPIAKTSEYQLLESAKMTLKEKRYKEAEDQFQQLLTKYPKSVFAPAATKYIDLCRLQMSKTAESQLLESAKMTSKESRYDEEEAQFQQVIKKYQKSGPVPANAKFIDRRIEMSETGEFQLFQSAKVSLKEKRHQEAEEQFQEFIRKYPKSVFAPAATKYIDICRLEISKITENKMLESERMRLKETRYKEGEEQFQQVLNKHQKSGPNPVAIKSIDRRTEILDAGEYQLFQTAKMALKEKRYMEAEDQFQQVLNKYPKSGLVPVASKYIVLCRLKMSEALEYKLLQSAKTALEEKHYKAAEDQFQQFLRKFPKSGLASAVTKYIELCRLEMSKLRPDAPKELDEPSKEAKNETNKTKMIPEISEPPLPENNIKQALKISETPLPENKTKMILKIPETASTGSTSDTLGNDAKTMPVTDPSSAKYVLGLKEYLASALMTNSSHLINSADFKREYANSATILKGYSFNVSLGSGAVGYYDNQFNYGANVTLNISKTLYDGGKKQILEKELEVVRLLSDAHLIESANSTTLIAVNLYTTFYYLQNELSLLKFNFDSYQDLMRRIENTYQKGVRFSSFDYYSSKSLNLTLERALLSKKAELLKAETAFRQFANINTDRQIQLKPLSITTSVNLVEMEKAVVLNNSAIKAARLQKDLQLQKIDERNAERGVTVTASSGLGFQFGSVNYIGTSPIFGSGFMPNATVGLNASLPIYDGGVKRANILAEEVEALKQKLVLKRTTEDIIKQVNDLYADYITLEKDLEITRELVDLNRKRTIIAMERFDKGLEEYRSVREAWSESILTEIDAVRQNTILQKLLVDMTILSGKKLFDL